MRQLKAGAVYFLVMFAAGWVLGPIRELVLIPWLGRAGGFAIESLIMLILIFFAAYWAVRRFAVPPTPASRLVMGLTALRLLFLSETLATWWMRGLRPVEYVASFDLFSGLLSILLYSAFPLMPLLIRPRNGMAQAR